MLTGPVQSTKRTESKQICLGGSVLLLEMWIELGWQGNDQVKPRTGVTHRKAFHLYLLSEPLNPAAVM